MSRQKFDYDLVILGGGSAGIVAGNVAGAVGARVALVERDRIGGECLWTGCVPSKSLLHAADVAHTMRHASAHGFADVEMSRDVCAGAFAYARRKVEETRNNDATEKMLRDFGVDIFHGEPRFRDAHTIETPQGDIKTANVLIATGSSPAVPDIPGLEAFGYLTNTTLFDLETVPESIGIIGGGYIACEMGQSLARLGAKVTIFERGDRLLKRDDPELVAVLTETLEREGITIHTGADIVEIVISGTSPPPPPLRAGEGESETDGVTLTRVPSGSPSPARRGGGGGEVPEIVIVLADGTQHRVHEILVATGRKPNTDSLHLHDVGVERGRNGAVLVDNYGRTTNRAIWACGDVTGAHQFSHMAEQTAKAVVRNILLPGSQKLPLRLVPYATFTSPELAHFGLTEAQAREVHDGAVHVLRHHFTQDDRAIAENETTGLVKVVTVGTLGKIVGASICGPHAGELIHEWVMAMHHNLPISAIADLVHVYPTLNVTNQRAAQKWYSGVMSAPLVKGALRAFGYTPRDANGL